MLAHVHDITGKLSLHELIAFISSCQLIVAASTGPLHIAAGTGVHAVGLYPCEKPMHAGRWAPLGKNVHTIEEKLSMGADLNITPQVVLQAINEALRPFPL
jgi:ADP-heptose:LPS heptosyltransferase